MMNPVEGHNWFRRRCLRYFHNGGIVVRDDHSSLVWGSHGNRRLGLTTLFSSSSFFPVWSCTKAVDVLMRHVWNFLCLVSTCLLIYKLSLLSSDSVNKKPQGLESQLKYAYQWILFCLNALACMSPNRRWKLRTGWISSVVRTMGDIREWFPCHNTYLWRSGLCSNLLWGQQIIIIITNILLRPWNVAQSGIRPTSLRIPNLCH